MINEVEQKVDQIESQSKCREEAMMNEIQSCKSREEYMMNKIEKMSSIEDALFRELKDSKENPCILNGWW